MAMSSVWVVGNSLLLGRHKPEFRSLAPRDKENISPQKRLGEEQKGEKIYAAQPK
jgi:hypothetical protein